MAQFKSNTVFATLMSLIITFAGVSANARLGLQCAAMFDFGVQKTASNDIARSNHSETAPETRYTFIPEHIRLTRRSKTEFFVDYVFRINNLPRLKTTELAMDYSNVIDANLQSGRDFLNAILTQVKLQKPNGTFIFIDVNNLGWVNKNFQNKMQSGDLYIHKTIDAIQTVIGEQGLVFRLGGDEFGIVLETMSPKEVQNIMIKLQHAIHTQAHSVFLAETKLRVAAFRETHLKRQKGEMTEEVYQAALTEFRTYTQYSQEGVSMGAAYIDGSLPSVIQQSAEKMAVDMKIKIKTAFNLDTAKYTGGVNLSNPVNRIKTAFRPEILQIMSMADFNHIYPNANKPEQARINDRLAWFSNTPLIHSSRIQDVFRFGQLGIGKYKNELKADEFRVEHFTVNGKRTTKTNLIEINTVTGLMDARSQGAKLVINHFLENIDKPGAENETIWISLLNLGKLNYFHKKTETGDIALGLAAKAIQSELVGKHVPFKHNGSDFLILTTDIAKKDVAAYKKVLENKLNSNILVDQIFHQEIDYILRTESDLEMRKAKIEEIQKLMSKKFKVF